MVNKGAIIIEIQSKEKRLSKHRISLQPTEGRCYDLILSFASRRIKIAAK